MNGNLVLSTAASYLVEVSPTDADRTNVTGTATLAGTVTALFTGGTYITRSYTILSAAGGRSGTFGGLASVNLPSGFAANLSYTSTDVLLNLAAILGQGAGLSQNQQNVANALNNFFNNGGALPANFVPVFNLSGANLGNALTQLSGEAATGAQRGGFQLTSQFLDLMLDPFVFGSGGIGRRHRHWVLRPSARRYPQDVTLAYATAVKAPLYKAPPPPFQPRWSAVGWRLRRL